MASCIASSLSSAVLALVLLAVAPALSLAATKLEFVYSIQRHGARNILPKSSTLKESEATGGPTLLPQGQRQCYEAGLAFNKRYISSSTCGATGTCLAVDATAVVYGVTGQEGVGFSNFNLLANSSALDRTIMSADSFFQGVFPVALNATNSSYLPSGQQLVPVYSVADSEDWRIRAYTKCPEYDARLSEWLVSSPVFKSKEQETAAFRDSIQQLTPQLNTSLSNWWNVYDAFNTYQRYQVGDQLPPIEQETFAQIVDLAMWLEMAKMSPQLTGNLLGGALLGDLLARLTAAEKALTAGSINYYRLLSVSSHYNTQLGLLSALQLGQQTSTYAWQHKIPSTAAVLVFELHSSSGSEETALASGNLLVRAVYQDGPKTQYAVLPLPCAEFGDAAEKLLGPGSCTLQQFMELATPQAITAISDWCDACGNNKVMACQAHNMARQLSALGVDPAQMMQSPSAAGDSRSGQQRVNTRSPGMIFVWCLVSVVAAALLAGCSFLAARRIRRGRKQQQPVASWAADDAI